MKTNGVQELLALHVVNVSLRVELVGHLLTLILTLGPCTA